MSGLVLVGLTMVGISWMAAIMDTGLLETQRMIGLIGGVSSLLAIGWWFLLRRLFTAQRVARDRDFGTGVFQRFYWRKGH